MKILNYLTYLLTFTPIVLLYQCKSETKSAQIDISVVDETIILKEQPADILTPEGMVWVEGKTFTFGAKPDDAYAMQKEMPSHRVTVDGFFIDITEVTNKQFKAFIAATNYITVAERAIDWEEMKKQVPEGTPKPHDSLLQPGSLIFNKDVNNVANMENYGQWWTWKNGANWQHPYGPDSDIEGKDNFPVIHIAYEDAISYCEWANRKLPTEAQWESAAQGTATDFIYTWGNNPEILDEHANTWQGNFPVLNDSKDGFEYIAPVKSYPPNTIGIYDMLGNVWEMTSDFFDVNHNKNLGSNNLMNPKGASKTFNPNNPYEVQRIIKGGSFLCNASYCASYRISAKMPMTLDSGSDHTGFRTVATVDMLKSE